MSKLIYELKDSIDFNEKGDLYVPKALTSDYRVRDLQYMLNTKSLGVTLKKCFSLFMYKNIDINRDLFEQMKFNKNIQYFYKQKNLFESNITLKDFKTDFIEIKVLNWHLIFFLNKVDFKKTDLKEVFNTIYEDLLDFSLDFQFELQTKKYEIKMNKIDSKTLAKLKTFHGTTTIQDTIKGCVLFYIFYENSREYHNIKREYLPYDRENYESEILHINLPIEIERKINSKYISEEIADILNFNINAVSHLFPEWK